MRPYSAALILLSTALWAQTEKPKPDEFEIKFEEVARERHYGQALRPQLHYTPLQGHVGDATGLIYYAGEYHLFYMYDEWSRRRMAHKQWGHAISTDLIHWKELPGVLDKWIDNSPGSGSGVVDWNNSSGLRAGPEKTLIIFYTDYKRGTCIAYSRDKGRTWTRHEKNPVLAEANDVRDPTVFWYAPAAEWRMLRYEKKGFAFYKSANLLDWTFLSRIDGFYECPDLIELPVLNAKNESRWVLIDGNGRYTLGKFDGQQFIKESEPMLVEHGKALYATQTWKRTFEGHSPVYQVAWTRYPMEPRLTWNGQVSFPVELTLWSFPEGVRLCRNPIDEIDKLRVSQQSWRDVTVSGDKFFPEIDTDLLDIQAEMESAGAQEFGLTVHGQRIQYSASNKTLSLGASVAPLSLADGKLRLRILVDRSSVEVFADRGQVTLAAVTVDSKTDRKVSAQATGGNMRIVSLKANRLESIWPEGK